MMDWWRLLKQKHQIGLIIGLFAIIVSGSHSFYIIIFHPPIPNGGEKKFSQNNGQQKPKELSPPIPSKEPKSVKLSNDTGLRSLPDVSNSPAYCELKMSDYVIPLEVIKSLNKVWCKVKVVDSKTCKVGDEGFIRPAKICNLPY